MSGVHEGKRLSDMELRLANLAAEIGDLRLKHAETLDRIDESLAEITEELRTAEAWLAKLRTAVNQAREEGAR